MVIEYYYKVNTSSVHSVSLMYIMLQRIVSFMHAAALNLSPESYFQLEILVTMSMKEEHVVALSHDPLYRQGLHCGWW